MQPEIPSTRLASNQGISAPATDFSPASKRSFEPASLGYPNLANVNRPQAKVWALHPGQWVEVQGSWRSLERSGEYTRPNPRQTVVDRPSMPAPEVSTCCKTSWRKSPQSNTEAAKATDGAVPHEAFCSESAQRGHSLASSDDDSPPSLEARGKSSGPDSVARTWPADHRSVPMSVSKKCDLSNPEAVRTAEIEFSNGTHARTGYATFLNSRKATSKSEAPSVPPTISFNNGELSRLKFPNSNPKM